LSKIKYSIKALIMSIARGNSSMAWKHHVVSQIIAYIIIIGVFKFRFVANAYGTMMACIQ